METITSTFDFGVNKTTQQRQLQEDFTPYFNHKPNNHQCDEGPVVEETFGTRGNIVDFPIIMCECDTIG